MAARRETYCEALPSSNPPTHEPGSRTRVPTAELDQMYRRYARMLWRVVGRLGVPDHGIEDVIHDTFMIACQKLPTRPGRASLRSWLCGIAVRLVHHSGVKRTRRERLSALIADLPRPPTPVEALERKEARAVLDAMIRTLPPNTREVFVLSDVEGLSGPEVANALGIGLNTAYSRLRIARREFSAAVAAWERSSP